MTGSGGFRRSVCQSNEGGSFSRSALVKRNQGKASAQRCWTKTLSQSSKRCPAATMVATSPGFGYGGSRDVTLVKAIVSIRFCGLFAKPSAGDAPPLVHKVPHPAHGG